jgi:RimJ/RimL family protein N-acetyltransferase
MRARLAALAEIRAFAGWRGLLARGRDRVFSRRRFGRWQIDLVEWTPRDVSGAGVEIRPGSLQELADLRRTSAAPVTPELYADRLHGARRVYLAFAEGRLAHVAWLFTHEDRTLQISLAPDEVEINFVYTVPAYRGRRVMTAVHTRMLEDVRRQGVRRAYMHVAIDNQASIRAVVRTGFRQAGTVTLTWLLGVPIVRYVPITRD